MLLKNKAKNLRPDDTNFLERIQINGKHLLGLINQILDLSKIEAGRTELDLTKVSLADLVRETLAQLEGQYRDKEVKLLMELPETVAPIETDESKLRQVIINLISNAFKFTKAGSVTVRVAVEKDHHRPIRVDIVDTGIGIPKEQVAAVFEAFQQADASTTRKYGGTGLGLTVSRALCQILGYRLTLQSEPGKGTTFSVWLIPEAEIGTSGLEEMHREGSVTRSDRVEPVANESHSNALQNKLVLIVDDELDARVLLQHMIESYGCRVVAASSGEEGIRMARECQPDLITVDLVMPQMDGWQLVKTLKADRELAHIPTVVVSVAADDPKGRILGAVDLVEKPLAREDLIAAIQRNRIGMKSKVLVVDDDSDTRQIVAECLEEEGMIAQLATNGREALEVLKSFAPDLVFVDLLMPEMDGVHLIDHIRADARHCHLPIIIITAKKVSPDEVFQLKSHMRGIIGKVPDLPEKLREIFQRILQSEGSRL